MKGILFKPDMRKAIVEGRKTVTRRVMQNQPVLMDKVYERDFRKDAGGRKSRYQVGEVVYIKEPWHYLNIEENKATPYDFGIEFADGEILWWTDNGNEMNYPLDEKKRSPMFLKAKFARYFIQIIGVRPERLQEITPEDCIAEGIIPSTERYLRLSNIEQYMKLWDSINPKHPWDTNPYLWVYTFKKVAKTIIAASVKAHQLEKI